MIKPTAPPIHWMLLQSVCLVPSELDWLVGWPLKWRLEIDIAVKATHDSICSVGERKEQSACSSSHSYVHSVN